MANKKVLMVIVADFRDPEYFKPKEIFANQGLEVKTASLKKEEITGADGGKTKAELAVGEVAVDEFSAVVFVGGPGMISEVDNPALIGLAQKFYQAGKLTTAICVSPAILANAGILQGKKATAWSGIQKRLEKGGADFTGENVTIDGKIITASGPQAAEKFAQTIVQSLAS